MKEETYRDPVKNDNQSFRPFFSIIITTYNRAQIIQRALDSLVSQIERDWEAVIVDDESTDDTYLRILPYLCSNQKIRYIKKVHSGEALSKNEGINSSSGKYISFLDSDDEYDPIHLQSRKAILKTYPSVRFLHGGAKIIGNQYVPDRFDYKKRINLSECVIGGTFFIERDLIFQLNGFRNIILGTDADLFERASQAGISIMETKSPTYIYHHENEDSITNRLIKSEHEISLLSPEYISQKDLI
jgi:glycosyltransferase involved in cell wall biosynthesis